MKWTLDDAVTLTYAIGVNVPPIVFGRRAASDTVGTPLGGVAESVAVSVADVPLLVAGIVTLAVIPPVIVSKDAVAGPLPLTESDFVDVTVGVGVGDGVPPPTGVAVGLGVCGVADPPPPPPPHAARTAAATAQATLR